MDNLGSTFILTARLDAKSQGFFNEMRSSYFPPELNLLNAHLTLFHKLRDTEETKKILSGLNQKPIKAIVYEIKNIGHGVAYFIDSPELSQIHRYLQQQFLPNLSLQDQQKIRPHITIQNKVKPEKARELLKMLQPEFKSFEIAIQGLDLWYYLNGPWEHHCYFSFNVKAK